MVEPDNEVTTRREKQVERFVTVSVFPGQLWSDPLRAVQIC